MDPVETSQELVEKLELGFPILADPQREIVKAFGIDDPGNEVAWPAVYVIDSEGNITWRAFLETYKERPPPDEILAAIDAAQG